MIFASIIELKASIYALNDALVRKGICDKEFLSRRKKFYEEKIVESLRLLNDIQKGKMTKELAEKRIHEISKSLVWDQDMDSVALKEFLENIDV